MANRLRQRDETVGGLSDNWFAAFKSRTPALKAIRTVKMNLNRQQVSLDYIRRYFKELSNDDFKDLPSHVVWNMDETGISEDEVKCGWILGDAETRGRVFQSSDGDRRWTTIVEAVSAGGRKIPPMMIFKAETNINLEWFPPQRHLRPMFDGWYVAAQGSAWITNELAKEWLKQVFQPNTKEEAERLGKRRLLIMDGHGSHNNEEFRMLCAEFDIDTLVLPPHTSHVSQPLDVSIYGPLKDFYRSLMRDEQGLQKLSAQESRCRFIINYARARAAIFTPERIIKSFEYAGIRPININKVLENSLIAKAVADDARREQDALDQAAEEAAINDRLRRAPSDFMTYARSDQEIAGDQGVVFDPDNPPAVVHGGPVTENAVADSDSVMDEDDTPLPDSYPPSSPFSEPPAPVSGPCTPVAVHCELATQSSEQDEATDSGAAANVSLQSSFYDSSPVRPETVAWWADVMGSEARVHGEVIIQKFHKKDMRSLSSEYKLVQSGYFKKLASRTQTPATGGYKGLYTFNSIFAQMDMRTERQKERERLAEEKKKKREEKAKEKERLEKEKQKKREEKAKEKEEKAKEKARKATERAEAKALKEKEKLDKPRGKGNKKRGRPPKNATTVVDDDPVLDTPDSDLQDDAASDRPLRKKRARTTRVTNYCEVSDDESSDSSS